jgi:hypothetical protein
MRLTVVEGDEERAVAVPAQAGDEAFPHGDVLVVLEPARVVQEGGDRHRVDVRGADPPFSEESLKCVHLRGIQMPVRSRAQEHAGRHVIGAGGPAADQPVFARRRL